MKRYIKSSEMTNDLRAWLTSPEVDQLMNDMEYGERQLVGKIANAKELRGYVAGIIDACQVHGAYMSSAFDTFLTELDERVY